MNYLDDFFAANRPIVARRRSACVFTAVASNAGFNAKIKAFSSARRPATHIRRRCSIFRWACLRSACLSPLVSVAVVAGPGVRLRLRLLFPLGVREVDAFNRSSSVNEGSDSEVVEMPSGHSSCCCQPYGANFKKSEKLGNTDDAAGSSIGADESLNAAGAVSAMRNDGWKNVSFAIGKRTSFEPGQSRDWLEKGFSLNQPASRTGHLGFERVVLFAEHKGPATLSLFEQDGSTQSMGFRAGHSRSLSLAHSIGAIRVAIPLQFRLLNIEIRLALATIWDTELSTLGDLIFGQKRGRQTHVTAEYGVHDGQTR